MEYRTISTKLPNDEHTLFKSFCEKKGVSPASLMRDLILREMKIPLPHQVAGNNNITYDKKTDKFNWSVKLDSGEEIEVLNGISPDYIQDLMKKIEIVENERNSFLRKRKGNSVSVPNGIVRK
jgi:hypothetical protein